jgi:RNA polymerase sigma-70 factor (ECF subfamily)
LSEQEIVIAIQQGNKQVFENLFRLYYAPLVGYANKMLGDKMDAEEVVQKLFCKLWENKESFSVSISVKSYLYKSVHNHSLNFIKHQKVKQQHAHTILSKEVETEKDASHLVRAKELNKKILAAIEQLPEQCRITFQLSRNENLKYAEIAETMGVSIKTVENQMGKALKHLRTSLAEYMVSVMLFLISWINNF